MSTVVHPLKLGGNLGSPYSLKMRAVLRYRHIPFTWVPRGSQWDDLPEVPVRLVPVIAFPDADGTYTEAQIDSSPLIARLETMYSERSIVPTDPVVAFLDYLVEDYADEWVTKAMYHYRWYYEDAIAKAGSLLPLDQNQQLPDAAWQKAKAFITQRQIGRMPLVGSTEQNRPVIERSYERLLDLLQSHFAHDPFLFGQRPGRSDFGLYGQLRQLVGWDPESARIAIARAPRVVNWVDRTDDLSWWPTTDDGAWCTRDTLSSSVKDLLTEVGRTYVPFMLANAKAIDAGEETVTCTIDGTEYSQGTFAYQRKCLGWLRSEYEALQPVDREAVNGILSGTGCEALFP